MRDAALEHIAAAVCYLKAVCSTREGRGLEQAHSQAGRS